MSLEIIGIDHIYIAVSDLRRSEEFYDRVMTILGFRKNTFKNEGDDHIQYYTLPHERENYPGRRQKRPTRSESRSNFLES